MLVIHYFFSNLIPWTMARIKIYKKMKAMGFTAMGHTTFQLFIPSAYHQKWCNWMMKTFLMVSLSLTKNATFLTNCSMYSDVSLHFFCWKLSVLFMEQRFVSLNLIHFHALTSLFHNKKPTNAHIFYSYHVISTVLLLHVLALREPSWGSTTDTFSQLDQ